MVKKNPLIVICLILVVGLVCVVVFQLFSKNNRLPLDNSNSNSASGLSEKSLGGHECLSKFTVSREVKPEINSDVLKLASFQSFRTGAFFGKIDNFEPGQNKQFSTLIDQLMKESKVATYLHLKADVCLYHEDLWNPENGASLNYYVEHYYCTNKCQTGKYEIEVDLDAEGNFVGYRNSQKVY